MKPSGTPDMPKNNALGSERTPSEQHDIVHRREIGVAGMYPSEIAML